MPRIEVQDGKFSACPSDKQLKASAMQPRVQRPRQRPSEPIRVEIVRERLQVSIELRQKLFDVHVAQVRSRMCVRRGKHQIDKLAKAQRLAVLLVLVRQKTTKRVRLILHMQRLAA